MEQIVKTNERIILTATACKGSLTIRHFLSSRLNNIFGQLFNFRIFIKLFIHEVKKTSKFWVLGLYLFNKYQ